MTRLVGFMCKHKGNYYHHERSDPHEWSWGYCSKDCFLDTEAGDGQVLRHIEKAHVRLKCKKIKNPKDNKHLLQ